jgi:predicted Zn-dependent protease with MMP-like domain
MTPQARSRFDRALEWVLAHLPTRVQQLLEEVPLHVEDYPSPRVMATAGVKYRHELCGWYDGIPLDQRSVTYPAQPPDMVIIYREGIMAAAADRSGRVRTSRLRKEIRVTILHELAHYHGISEEELDELGYA